MLKLLLLLPLALMLVGPVHATKPSGITFTVNSGMAVPIQIQTVGSVTYITAKQNLTFTGGLQGSSSQVFSAAINATGNYTVGGSGTFTGTVNGGQLGTAQYVFSATGTMNPYTQNGHLTFGRGSGGLAGLHLEGPYHATSPVILTISVTVHFDSA